MGNKLVYGKGVNDVKKISVNGKHELEYIKWHHMLNRCYSPKWHKTHPTYIGCSVHDDWLLYSKFKSDYKNMVGFELGWELDKDLLVKGNKVYSKETCVLLPKRINTLLINRKKSRGLYPIGVCLCSNNKYLTQCSDGYKQKHLGYHNTLEQAFQVYKTFKENLIKQVASEYKDMLDVRAYNALMNYTINIDD